MYVERGKIVIGGLRKPVWDEIGYHVELADHQHEGHRHLDKEGQLSTGIDSRCGGR